MAYEKPTRQGHTNLHDRLYTKLQTFVLQDRQTRPMYANRGMVMLACDGKGEHTRCSCEMHGRGQHKGCGVPMVG